MINKIHERSLRVVYNDEISDFKSLLAVNNDVTIHCRNIQVLLTEVFKIKNGLAPPIMDAVLTKRDNIYNIRNIREYNIEK